VWCCLCDPTFSRFSRTPTCDGQTDRWTDGQTDGHRASTADAEHRAVKMKRDVVVVVVVVVEVVVNRTNTTTTCCGEIF